jgi:hypothetical protein
MTTTRSIRRSFALVLSLSFTAAMVVAPPTAQASHLAKPTDDDKAAAALKAIVGYVSHKKMADQDPNTFEGAFAIAALKGLRDGVVDGAIDDLFPNISNSEKVTVRGFIIKSFDGNRQSKDKMIELLKRTHPDIGDLLEIADFIDQVNRLLKK